MYLNATWGRNEKPGYDATGASHLHVTGLPTELAPFVQKPQIR